MLRVGEADGDVEHQTAGDHEDIGVNIARITNEPGGVGG